MKNYINLFLTYILPLNILFTAMFVIYYLIDVPFAKAIKLGIVTGVLSGTLISLVVAAIILMLRKFQPNKYKAPMEFSTGTLPKAFQEPSDNSHTITKPPSLERKIILLMDKELAYALSLRTLQNLNTGEIIYQNKSNGTILMKEDTKELKMDISTLSRHTAEILLTSTLDSYFIKDIITTIKEKEYAFLK